VKRGTRVGQAYVAVTADGDGINEEIVDSVDKAGPGVDKAAGKQSKRYSDRFAKTLEDLPAKVSKKLDQALGFEMEKTGSRVGDRMGRALADAMGSRVEFEMDRIHDSLDALADRIEAAVSGNRGGGGGAGSGGGGGGGGGDENIGGDEDDGRRFLRRVNDNFDVVAMFEAARVKLHADSNAQIEKADIALRKEQQKIYDALVKDIEKQNLSLLADSRKQAKLQQSLFEKAQREQEKITRLAASAGRDRDLGATVGRAFGAGSRNDFLNFFGRTLGGIVSLTEKVRVGASSMFKTFMEGFDNAAEGAGLLTRLMSGFKGLGGGGGFLASIGAAAPAIGVVTVALSVLASVMSALLGIATALASVIVTGLIGGFGVLAGTLGAVTVAGLLLTAAFMSMDDAQKEALKNTFKPLHEEMIGIGQVMLTQMIPYFAIWSKNLQEALLLAAPLAGVMGTAFGEAGAILTEFLSGPGFTQLSYMLATQLPGITVALSSALGGFLNGLSSTFALLLPYVSQFSNYLSLTAARFANWAASAQGQNAISDFFSKASDALKSLWNGTREFFGFLSDVLFSDAAVNAGITIFDALADKFADFREAVATAIENGDLERWFNDAIEFGAELWGVIESLGGAFIALSDSGVLDAVGSGLAFIAGVIEVAAAVADPFVELLGMVASLLDGIVNPADRAKEALGGFADVLAKVDSLTGGGFLRGLLPGGGKSGGSRAPGNSVSAAAADRAQELLNQKNSSLSGLIGKGGGALGRTSDKDAVKKYTNPYKDMAERLIKEAPRLAEQLRAALRTLNKAIVDVIRESYTSTDITQTRTSISKMAEDLILDARSAVEKAESAVSSAASSLAGASSKDAASNALRNLKNAQKDLKAAQANQLVVNKTAKIIDAQRYTSLKRIKYLLRGIFTSNATLADYTSARSFLTKKLEAANQKLADAIAMRDQYRTQVTDAANQFGSLITTQAQVIGGIEQALTVTDITTNLQTRLDKIKKFQEDLRVLSSQGLSQAAYKQIVDAGVEDGSRFTEALLAGGVDAVGQVNSLVKQVGDASASLGLETSNRMYQAGVDAAKGLVDGLASQRARLDREATRLGTSIANAVRRSLGIKSPSTVLMNDMNYAGDGLVKGLDKQHSKVDAAADALARRISVTPRTGVTGGDGASAGVSGNSGDPRFRDLIVQTPTEDPKAVAKEVLNEVTGRL
jgi:hypothetical protein